MRSSVGRVWRWCAVAASVALLALVPLGLAKLPATAELPERALMRKIRASDSIPYQGVAESSAGLGLPDVPRAGRLVDLFSETTRMRVWVAGPKRWRVDSLTPIGERDTYRDLGGTWIWDSSERTALRVEGEGIVRFARPADLLPPELGRRLTAAAQPEETSALPARRVTGIDAAGIRIAPRAPATTLERVDVWADPGSGLPLRVEVTARTVPGPLLTTSFLELEQVPPPAELVEFTMPAGAEVHSTSSPDDELSALPARAGPWGHVLTVSTPLLNGMLFASNEVAYVLGGSVEMTVLERFATQLARGELEVRG